MRQETCDREGRDCARCLRDAYHVGLIIDTEKGTDKGTAVSSNNSHFFCKDKVSSL